VKGKVGRYEQNKPCKLRSSNTQETKVHELEELSRGPNEEVYKPQIPKYHHNSALGPTQYEYKHTTTHMPAQINNIRHWTFL